MEYMGDGQVEKIIIGFWIRIFKVCGIDDYNMKNGYLENENVNS